jgi:hypothetical protein
VLQYLRARTFCNARRGFEALGGETATDGRPFQLQLRGGVGCAIVTCIIYYFVHW